MTTTQQPTKPLFILIAGPYRSGTGDDPALLRANLDRLEAAAWPLFAAGHLPMIGEWVALPVLRGAGGTSVADPVAEQIMYPTAQRLLPRCDAVLRLPGASNGADQDVAIAEELGLAVYHDIADVPPAVPGPTTDPVAVSGATTTTSGA